MNSPGELKRLQACKRFIEKRSTGDGPPTYVRSCAIAGIKIGRDKRLGHDRLYVVLHDDSIWFPVDPNELTDKHGLPLFTKSGKRIKP